MMKKYKDLLAEFCVFQKFVGEKRVVGDVGDNHKRGYGEAKARYNQGVSRYTIEHDLRRVGSQKAKEMIFEGEKECIF